MNAEKMIPENAPVRLADAQLEELDYRRLYKAYSPRGRNPATDPRVMFKVLVYSAAELHLYSSLRNRGVEDIFIACTDNFTGLSAAIEAVFPKTEIQNCVIHQIRNSTKCVSYQDLKPLMADLKAVYAAAEPAVPLWVLHENRRGFLDTNRAFP